MQIYNFERIEKKFLLTKKQHDELLKALEGKYKETEYGDYSTISVYCDTPDWYLIRRSIEKPAFKEKLRIRSYDGLVDDAKVFLELKRKYLGVVYKRRTSAIYSNVKKFFQGEPIETNDSQKKNEIYDFFNRYNARPVASIYYKRHPLIVEDSLDKTIRITFDSELKYDIKDPLNSKPETMDYIVDSDFMIMEIKSERAIPIWLANILSELKIYRFSFSKIGTCYTRHVASNIKS